jgi:UDP-GlcNAc:undecaprenyl-phosphate/decaprenyl-phosphate GlcNAc-1-phosphate transferase
MLGLVWLVGITNAFNLLDNMDGLAASLAAVSCAVFAVAALDQDSGELGLVIALALGGACLGFLPFNLRPGRSARVFMGDSGSQVIGFGLASLALASSWTTAGATLTSIVLPLLVLAIPILDTTLVTVRRTLERRPVTQGGTDHSSHRLVYYGLSEQQAVAALTLLAALLGATALAYNVLANARVTAVGVLISFVVLVQFASFLGDLQERSRQEDPGPAPPLWRAFLSNPRRLVEVLTDFAIVCVSFLIAYLLFVDGRGNYTQRGLFLATLPILLGVRYVLFVLFGIYRRIWRFASARDLLAIGAAVALSAPITIGIVRAIRSFLDFPLEVFVVDGLLCMTLVAASRLALRMLPGLSNVRGTQKRVLIAGAGRSGRALARELAETPDTRVVGFVDDNPALRRRRIHGVTVHGGLDDVAQLLGELHVDEVLVTIPEAASERLESLVASCTDADVGCRFVVREIAPPPFRTRVPAE